VSLLIGLLWGLGVGLLLLLGALLIVAAFPVRLLMRAGSEPAIMHLRLQVLGGVVPMITLVDTSRPKPAHKRRRKVERKARKAAKHKARQKPGRPSRRDRALRLLRAAPAFLRDLLAQLRVEVCRGQLWFGLPDPADTGHIYGLLVPFALASQGRVHLSPDFDAPCLRAEGDCVVSVVPLRLLGPVLRFGWAGFGSTRSIRRRAA